MSGCASRRLAVLLVSGAAAFGVWKWTPGTKTDRSTFRTVAGGFVNGPLFLSGHGTRADPWKLRAFATVPKADKQQAPVIVSLGDDPDQIFNTSPPGPIDLAVIFRNFQRLGATKAASAAVLAWESPDALGLAALEMALAKFDALVTAAPLSRGAVASPIPPAFRRASIPATSLHGDSADIPLVNRIPIPGVILGGETAMAGFSVLESESVGNSSALLARWDDRIVFSFPLLTAMQRANLPIDGLEIWPGKYLKLGPDGPTLPIDRYGRLSMAVKSLAPFAVISAEALIDGGDELFPKTAPDPVILRDDRSAAEPATRGFSQSLSGVIAAISSDQGMADVQAYPRLSERQEMSILGAAAALLAALCGLPPFRRNLLALLLAGGVVSAQWIAFGAGIWLPGAALLAAVAAMVVISALVAQRSVVTTVETDPPAEPVAPAPPDTILPEPPAAAPTKDAGKKASPRKIAAKKSARPKGGSGKK